MSVPTLQQASADGTVDIVPTRQSPQGRVLASSLGFLLLCGALGLLVWNEGRAVQALRGSGSAARSVASVAAAVVDPAYDGRLVHLSGALGTTAPLTDPAMGLEQRGLVHLKRTVEMYQWKQIRQASVDGLPETTGTGRATYSYAKRWSEGPIDSRRFKTPLRHENPPMPFRSEIATAQDATIGTRTVVPALLKTLDDYRPIAPPAGAPRGFARTVDGFYKGADPDAPEIGDVRIRFAGVPGQPVSVIAEQRGSSLAPFRSTTGHTVGFVAPGAHSAAAMVAREGLRERALTWARRGAGFALLALALALMVPPLPGAGRPAFALAMYGLALAAPLALATIGLSWIVMCPLLGVVLLVAAALLVLACRHLRRSSWLTTSASAIYPSPASSWGR